MGLEKPDLKVSPVPGLVCPRNKTGRHRGTTERMRKGGPRGQHHSIQAASSGAERNKTMHTNNRPGNTSANDTDRATDTWAGCDVAKDTFDAALWITVGTHEPRAMKDIPVETFERSPEGVREFLAWADETAGEGQGPMRAVMEATGKYSAELAVWMIGARSSLSPAIINPETARRFAQSLALRNKTDRTDARALARYGAERRPVAFEPPTAQLAELRDLSRHRQALIEMRVAEENRAKESTASPLVRKMLKRHIAQLRRDEKAIEEEMKKVLEKSPDLRRDAKLLQTVYSVGLITATSVLAELGDLRRFERARQLTAFAGASPSRQESGASVHRRTRMSKKGSSRIRKALYMAAMTAIRGDSDLADTYHRLVAKKKPKMAAIGAVMRKLLVVMRAVVISGQPYQKHYRKPVHNC